MKEFLKRCRYRLLGGSLAEIEQQCEEIGRQCDEMKDQYAAIRGQYEEICKQNKELCKQNKELRRAMDVIGAHARDAAIGAVKSEYAVRNFQGSLQSSFQIEVMSRYMDIEKSKLYRQTRRLHELLPIKNISNRDGNLVRVGNLYDGGYVALDRYFNSNIAYSFGISTDVSWDKYMAEQGFDVYMYDHTIEGLPEEHEKFHWRKIGIAGIYNSESPELKTFPMLMEENGHTDSKNIILKMDIEGAEWEVFDNLPDDDMTRFDQILIEMHDLNSEENFSVKERVLEKLNKTHQLVHIHGNHNEPYVMVKGMVMPNVIECTYVKKGLCEFEDFEGFLPDELDRPNNPFWPDIYLGKWNP